MTRSACGWIWCGVPVLAFACAPVPPGPGPSVPGPSVPPTSTAGVHLIVAVGDSYGSGQGAPDAPINWWVLRFRPRWENRRCNRSLNTGARQAVGFLQADPGLAGHTFAYQSFACSGASIEHGMLGPQRGTEPPSDPADMLPPQVEDVRLLAQQQPIDALIMTIGGNDILFEYIVAACMLGTGQCNLINPILQSRIGQLGGRLTQLADALALTGVPADRIFLVQYPDPTTDDAGTYCDHKPAADPFGRISECEARWVSQCVLPRLNHQLCAIAEARGWNYVRGPADGFHTHGWCASANWINTIGESVRAQGHYRGGMHPNADGYAHIGSAIADAVRGRLLGTAPPPAGCVQTPQPAFCDAPCGLPVASVADANAPPR